MASWMTGDTFLEVATTLARTDISDPVSFNHALEVVKRYVRAKIKKGKGKEVAAPGGKLEQLEAKYAHLGFQDVFYLTRLQLALPPSAITLPRPRSPIRKLLVNAKYPLPPAYQLPSSNGLDITSNAPASPAFSAVSNDAGRRGRGDAVKELSWTSAGRSSTSTLNINLSSSPSTLTSALPVTPAIELGQHQFGIPAQQSQQNVKASPTPMTIPRTMDAARDHFDHLSSTPTTSPLTAQSYPRSHLQTRMPSARPPQPQRLASNDETDVRRMLQARINALQTALHSLEVDESQPIPISASMSRPGSSSSAIGRPGSSGSTRIHPPAPSPPPTVPLPPTPTTAHDFSRPSQDIEELVITDPPNQYHDQHPQHLSQRPHGPLYSVTPLSRASSTLTRLLPATPTPIPPSPSTGMMFDLDPELASDPFAAQPAYNLTRAEREQAAYMRARGDLRKIKVQTGDEAVVRRMMTPPPRYEVDGTRGEVGRAVWRGGVSIYANKATYQI